MPVLQVGVVTADGQHRLIDRGPLPEAVAASAAIPFVFQSVDIPGAFPQLLRALDVVDHMRLVGLCVEYLQVPRRPFLWHLHCWAELIMLLYSLACARVVSDVPTSTNSHTNHSMIPHIPSRSKWPQPIQGRGSGGPHRAACMARSPPRTRRACCYIQQQRPPTTSAPSPGARHLPLVTFLWI